MRFIIILKVISVSVLLFYGNNSYSLDKNTSFYGLVDVYGGVSKVAGAGSENGSIVVNSNGMTTSFIGVKTKIELTDNLYGLAKLESFFRPDVGEEGRFAGDDFFARNAYIGLEGNFGSITLGRNTTPYFVSIIISNPFGGSFGFSPSIKHSFLGGLQGDSSWGNSLQYNTPDYNGVRSSIIYSTGEMSGAVENNRLGISTFFENRNINATLAFQTIDTITENNEKPKNDNQIAGMVGLSYNLKLLKIYGQYQYMNTEASGVSIKYNTAQVGSSIPFEKSNVLVSVSNTDKYSINGVNRKTYALGYDYEFNKTVDLYTVIYLDDTSDKGKSFILAIGGRISF